MSVAVKEERIPNWRLRKEFQRRQQLGWVTASDVATRMDWVHTDGKGHEKPDSTMVLRVLGLVSSYNGYNSAQRVQRTISVEMAARLAEAMGVDPWEVGL